MATVYADSSDGYAASGLGSWAYARDDNGNSFDSNNTYDTEAIYHYYTARRGQYGIRRAFLNFDASGISIAPSSATLKIYGRLNGEGDVIAIRSLHGPTLSASDFNKIVGDGTAPTVVTQLGASDGNGAGTLASVPGLTYSNALTTWSISGYNDIPLNATALANMASLSLFQVCLMNYEHDYLDQDGTTIQRNGVFWSETFLTGYDPYIDYTEGVSVTDNATFFWTNC